MSVAADLSQSRVGGFGIEWRIIHPSFKQGRKNEYGNIPKGFQISNQSQPPRFLKKKQKTSFFFAFATSMYPVPELEESIFLRPTKTIQDPTYPTHPTPNQLNSPDIGSKSPIMILQNLQLTTSPKPGFNRKRGDFFGWMDFGGEGLFFWGGILQRIYVSKEHRKKTHPNIWEYFQDIWVFPKNRDVSPKNEW